MADEPIRTPVNPSENPESPITLPSLASSSSKRPVLSRAASSIGIPFRRSSSSAEYSLADDQFSGLTLLDLFVVLEAHLDLLTRRVDVIKTNLVEKSNKWRSKAEESYQGLKTRADEVLSKKTLSFNNLAGLSPDFKPATPQSYSARRRDTAAERVERELAKYRSRAQVRFERFQERWNDASEVSRREKYAFMFGVMNVCISSLLLGFKPEWIPLVYTIQILCLMPVRVYTYRQRNFHYFLLDNCYFINLLALVYIWICPGSSILFQAVYALSHGPLASAVITWRNSLVFHSLEKVTSLFIHVYPPFVFTAIVHHYPDASTRFPALQKLETLNFWETMIISSVTYIFWQVLYWYFVIVKRKEKIEKGGRVTSFTFLLQNPKGVIGWIASWFKPQDREHAFMVFQYLYTVVTILPVFWTYNSSRWSGGYLLFIFAVSVWNGATFYLDVWGRRFEKEITRLRKELEALQQETRSNSSAGQSPFTMAADESPSLSIHGNLSENIEPLSLDAAVEREQDEMSGESAEIINAEDYAEEVSDKKKD